MVVFGFIWVIYTIFNLFGKEYTMQHGTMKRKFWLNIWNNSPKIHKTRFDVIMPLHNIEGEFTKRKDWLNNQLYCLS